MSRTDELIQAIAKVEDPAIRKQMMADLIAAESVEEGRKEVRGAVLGGYSAVTPAPPGGLKYTYNGPVHMPSQEEAEAYSASLRQNFRENMPKQTPPVKREPMK